MIFNKAKQIAEKINKLRFYNDQKEEIGLTPGKLVFVGVKKQNFCKITLTGYSEDSSIEVVLKDIKDFENYRDKYTNIWINVEGVHDIESIREISKYFNIHELVQEDILHTRQPSKIDIEDNFVFVITKIMRLDKETKQLYSEQLSIYLDENVLISFKETSDTIFDAIRSRIRNKKGRVYSKGLDYLKYCLLDVITDEYNEVMQYFGFQIEDLEDRILLSPTRDTLKKINECKLELNFFRKNIRPVRSVILNLNYTKIEFLKEDTQVFFDDLHDGINRAYESAESYKSMLIEQLTVYSINVNNKMNDIMKVLTIFSAIFIPLTFIAGIYGTNFDNLPELHFKNGYFVMWGVMIVIAIIMLMFFKIKKWF